MGGFGLAGYDVMRLFLLTTGFIFSSLEDAPERSLHIWDERSEVERSMVRRGKMEIQPTCLYRSLGLREWDDID